MREGLKVVDVTDPDHPFVTLGNTIRLADAGGLFVARTWVYVAAGDEGLVIVDAGEATALKRYDVVAGSRHRRRSRCLRRPYQCLPVCLRGGWSRRIEGSCN